MKEFTLKYIRERDVFLCYGDGHYIGKYQSHKFEPSASYINLCFSAHELRKLADLLDDPYRNCN